MATINNSGISINGIHNKDLGVFTKIMSRPILPEKRKNKVKIPGLDGTINLGNGEYEEILIEFKICIIETTNINYRNKAREVAGWIKGENKKLIFDDEPNLEYTGECFSSVDLEELFNKVGECTVIFECEPFPKSI